MRFKKLFLIPILLSISCASFQTRVLNYGNIAYEAFNNISQVADQALATNQITKEKRVQIAKDYMIPGLTALDELITITKSYNPDDPIPTQFFTILSVLTRAYDDIMTSIGRDSNLFKVIEHARDTVVVWLQNIR